MLNKKGQLGKLVYTMAIIVAAILVGFAIYTKMTATSNDNYIRATSQIDLNKNGIPYQVERHMEGSCPCDVVSVPKYYYFKEEAYDVPSEWSENIIEGYLLGYSNNKQIEANKLIDNPVSVLRLSEHDLSLIESKLSEKNPDLNQLLSSMDFEEIKFTPGARLGQLCVPELTKNQDCTYDLFVQQLLKNDEGVPILDCKTTVEECKLKFEREFEKTKN